MEKKKKLQIKKIEIWEKFTDWVMQTIYPEVHKYHKQLPHLSKSLTEPLAKILVFLFTLNLYLSLIGLIFTPFYLFMGVSGIFLIIYLLTFVVLGFSFKKEVSSFTKRGWEYLFSLTVFEIIVSFIQGSIGVITSPYFIIPFLLSYIFKFLIVLYLFLEIKPEFTDN